MTKYVGAIDQGTSSTRFIVFDEGGSVVESHQTEFEQIYPQAGWAEHNPQTIYETVVTCIEKTVQKMVDRGLQPLDIKAIGITNQRETTIVWDRETGEPLHNAIVWLDTRTKATVERLTQQTASRSRAHFQRVCGLPLSTYFSAVKLRWLLDHDEPTRRAMEDDRLMVGTVDSWLIYKLTGGAGRGVHVTDVTNASRTMLLNLETLEWDDSMLEFFGVRRSALPEVRSSSEVYGLVADGPLKGLPISGDLGDQQAALVGQRCFEPGMVKNTYGTGCFMLLNTGTQAVQSQHGLLTTVGFKLGKEAPVHYALEGSVAIAGAAVKWLRDNLGLIKEASEINEHAGKVSDTAGVYFVPAFSGLFAPYWRDDARGCLVGMTQYTNKSHLCRATLEAVAFQAREIMDAMNSDSGQAIQVLRVDGGLTNSDLCMQIQADIAGVAVDRPQMRETTALGAALAAGLAVGVWRSAGDFAAAGGQRRFEPEVRAQERERRLGEWRQAVQKSLGSVWEMKRAGAMAAARRGFVAMRAPSFT
ncbi:Glycerol kinase [Polyrhizophydium stewartii]|uniref:glycerol kinase n=1 Tax=Polyrhizophydium stewartii TaxID=2732419 RepID=A0ABR4NCC9_9FUNG